MTWWKATAALALLGGCADLGLPPYSPTENLALQERLAAPVLWATYQREFEQRFTEEPFELGQLALVASEGGELRTWSLVPCQGGASICGGSEGGPAGRLLRTPDYFVVEGLYGRRFWLSYGGDGYVERVGTYVPLAWDARPNGTGPGFDPALETPFRHH